MKKLLLSCTLMVAAAFSLNAQIIKSGNITVSETWTNNNIYLLDGWVFVKAGVTVTIQPGTVIKGDFITQGALIVERDGKLVADGTVDQPIVFTSQKSVGQRSYGDWGGVILCGRASTNWAASVVNGTTQGEGIVEGGVGTIYGGGLTPNDDDSSGVLRHVRIEFPGIAFQPNSEINGLTMCGVGRKTVIDYVQVSYSGDDSFEWFGGTVNCKHLIAYRGWDDDFDTDYGFQGKVQFAVSMRDPNIADQSGSNGFESDNNAGGTPLSPRTRPVFSNVSVFGPYCFNSTINSLYRRGAHLRRDTECSIFNSVFAGYPVGLLIESSNTQANATGDSLRIRNTVFAEMADTLAATSSANPNNTNGSFNIGNPSTSTGWFYTAGFNNSNPATVASLMINNLNLTTPNLTLAAGSPLLSGATFTDSYVNNSWFTNVSYVGAFDGTNDWTDCWGEWDPQNQAYNTSINNAFTVTATAQGATTFCQGGSVTLDAGSYPGATFAWSNGGTTQTINVTTSGTYSCTVTKSNGCVATSNAITVTVNPLPTAPTINASGSTTFCNGGSVDLTSSQATGIMWSNNATSQMITVNASGTYDVTYTDGNGCSATSAPTTVTVNANPSAPTISASGPTSFCTGDSVVLSSSQASGNVWAPNSETTQSITVMNSGSYSVTYTDGNGCSATSATTTVSSSSAPAPTVQVSGSTSLCPGETVTLTASTADSYLWSPGGETTQSITVSAAGTYFVTVTNNDPCNGVGASSSTTVTVLAAPVAGFTWSVPVINQYGFTNTSTGATIYAWDFGDGDQSSNANPTHIYSASGTYTVTLIATGANGCTDTMTTVINFVSGVEEQTVLAGMTLYPNPANELVNIAINLNTAADVTVIAYDVTGQILVNENQDLASGNTMLTYNTADWSNGIYFFQVTTGDVTNTVRVVIAK
jgi:PKD repeat protein